MGSAVLGPVRVPVGVLVKELEGELHKRGRRGVGGGEWIVVGRHKQGRGGGRNEEGIVCVCHTGGWAPPPLYTHTPMLNEGTAVMVPVSVIEGVPAGDTVTAGVRDGVPAGVPVPAGVTLGVPVRDGVLDGVPVIDGVTAGVPVGVLVREGVPVMVEVVLGVGVLVEVVVNVGDCVDPSDAVGDALTDGTAVELAVAVKLPLGEQDATAAYGAIVTPRNTVLVGAVASVIFVPALVSYRYSLEGEVRYR